MVERADSHIHVFRNGFQGGFTARLGVQIDELACFDSLAADHHVTAALVVGYTAEDCYRDNNQFLAENLAQHDWINATAFVSEPDRLTVVKLESWRQQGFVGISIYLFSDDNARSLQQCPDEVWAWLMTNRWLISVNSRGEYWHAWVPILERHETLRVVISHLGLPPTVSQPPAMEVAQQALDGPLVLAKFPGPRVKLSGFYDLTEPGHDYPHEAAWPFVDCLRAGFGVDRLLWASDYPACLDTLSYPQTFTMFGKMPFFSTRDCEKIEGRNLHSLLAEVRRA